MIYKKDKNNPMYGKRHTKKSKEKMGMQSRGEKNYSWKGDKVGYRALHDWVRRRKPKPRRCIKCKKRPPYDLANISGKYKRDVKDFEWLCRKCHMAKDNRVEKIRKKTTTSWFKKCDWCGELHKVNPYDIKVGYGKYCSKRCSNKGRMVGGKSGLR